MLIDRIVFGTARLTGGLDRRSAIRVLETALAGGIRHVDTAPTYGLGTVEKLVGSVLSGRPDVAVTAKVGLAHPRAPFARSIARRIKRTVAASTARPQSLPPPEPPTGAPGAGRFDTDFMERSFATTRRNLGRDTIDLLLLHEAFAADATPEVLAWLDLQRRAGRVRGVGFSNGSLPGPAADRAFPGGFTAQCAAAPQWVEAQPEGDLARRPRILHSIALTANAVQQRKPEVKHRVALAAAAFGNGEPTITRSIAIIFAILHHRVPDARLIFASTDNGRISDFLAAVHEIDALGTANIAERFDGADASAQ